MDMSEALAYLQDPIAVHPEGTSDSLLDEWERACGHTFPSSYREFIKIAAGRPFRATSTTRVFCTVPRDGYYEPVTEWFYVSGPSLSNYDPDLISDGAKVEPATLELRESFVYETGGLGERWAPYLVVIAGLLSTRRWLCFDFAYDAVNPPVVMFDDQVGWEDFYGQPGTIQFVARTFDDFIAGLEVRDFYIEPPSVASPTEESVAWDSHQTEMLGGFTGQALKDELFRLRGW